MPQNPSTNLPPVLGPAGYPIVMVRNNLDNLPDWTFPEGYGMRPMEPGDERLWEDIQRDAEPYFEVQPGLFLQEFGHDLENAWRRVFLITNPKGCSVGTMGAWYNPSFQGKDFGRIHWVATRPSSQGQGLAKASLAAALRVLAGHHQRAYLDTQTRRIPAISIYLDAGFRPFFKNEADRALWSAIAYDMGKPQHTDWINEAVLA
ncbi:MAG: GNAT family N-acetyltransferase [Opitutaceae bacterium]